MWVQRLICVVLLGVCALKTVESAMSPEQLEKTAAALRNTCIQKTGVDSALVKGIKKGEFPEDDKLKCYTNCVMKSLRTFKHGAIDMGMIESQLDMMMEPARAEAMKAGAKKCHAEVVPGQDPCSITFYFTKCSYFADPSVFYYP